MGQDLVCYLEVAAIQHADVCQNLEVAANSDIGRVSCAVCSAGQHEWGKIHCSF